MKIRIGTRGSKLALWQAYLVEGKLQQAGADTEIVVIETKGDKILDQALSKIGSKGVFTQELENQLKEGTIDIAVHSAKDLQSSLPEDFKIIAFTEREQPNDVLVSFLKDISLTNGKKYVVGTSSTRRVAMLKNLHPHIKTTDMRGNLQTRLRKLEEGQCDALLLAYAGVHRMGYDHLISEILELDTFTPAVGQGSIAIECSTTLPERKQEIIRSALNHPETEICLKAERAFLKRLEGGCSIPVFGLAIITGASLLLKGGIVSLDGSKSIRQNNSGLMENAEDIGITLAQNLLDAGAHQILNEIKQSI